MKKILLSVIIALVAIVSILPVNVQAASVTEITTGTSGDYSYTVYLENGKYWAELTDYTGTSSNPTIPTTIGGYSVTKLGWGLFEGDTAITKVTIPDNITVIDNRAFNGCSNLTNVTLPNGLTKLGEFSSFENSGVFYNCDKLTSIVIPKTVTTAGCAFADCDNLVTVTLESGMTKIPDNLFSAAKNSNLNVVIPSTVTEIGGCAFEGSAITKITLPNSIKIINNRAFNSCSNLTNVTLPNGLTKLGEFSSFESSGVFYNCDKLTSIVVPKTVITAGCAFADCDNLATVTLENGMTKIPDNLFRGTTNPNINIVIPSTVTEVGASAFEGSNMLKITLPNSIKIINDRAFNGCSNLTNVTLPNGLTKLGENTVFGSSGAFYNCDGLTSIVIPKTLTTAGCAFAECSNLVNITLESGMKKIPDNLFMWTSNPNLNIVIPNTVTEIGYATFRGSNILSVTLPSTIRKIGQYAFKDSTNITNITIPYKVSYIAKEAFGNWTNSQTINFQTRAEYFEWDSKWKDGCSANIKWGTRGLKFTDVKISSWYYDAVEYCFRNGIISGTSATTFEPSTKLTRGMLVVILYKMEGSPKVTGENKFSDVKSGKYYYNAVVWASNNGIVSGYKGTTKFGPNDKITRQDLAGMLSNYARYKNKYVKASYDLTSFSDSSKVSNYALPAMRWAVKNNIINGSNGKLNPKGNATRAEAAAMIYNYCLNIK